VYLGIDLGTSSVKAVLVDDSGGVVDTASASLEISRPHPGWSEQDPEAWWSACNKAVHQLDAKRRQAVRGIGLSGQMHGAVLLNAADRVLRPAILWNDSRSEVECVEIERAEPSSRKITANIAMPGFTAPKLLWVRKHEPHVLAATRTVLLPKDYLRLRMTSAKASDLSDAAGTLWVDVAKRAWSDAMLAATGLSTEHMPRLHEGPEITGELSASVAQAWGMDCVGVVAGGGDNAAGAVGVGVVSPGDAFLSLGTSGVIFIAGDRVLPSPERTVHAFCHCLPNLWHQMAVMLSAASCIEWAVKATGAASAAALLGQAEARARLDGPEIFLPYLSGERTPHNDAQARGVLFGVTHDTDSTAIIQSVLEGAAFGLADCMDALRDAGATVRDISVIGGGARSRWWGRILAAAIGAPLVYRAESEVGPALGAARLARIGLAGASVEEVCTPPPVREIIEPDHVDAEQLAPKRETFKRLYQDLRARFRDRG
jgi:xylulokinase